MNSIKKTLSTHAKSNKTKASVYINTKLKKAIYLEISKYCFDISKLVFGGIILANIMSLEINKIFIFVTGTAAVLLLSIFSLVLFIKGKE